MLRNRPAAPEIYVKKRPRPTPPEEARAEATDLCHLARGLHVSQSAMEGILRNVAERGLPSAPNRRTQRNARHRIANEEIPVGSCIVDLDLPLRGGPAGIAVGSPFATLYRLDSECAEFSDSNRELYARRPCTPEKPWHLIFDFDAVSPSKPLEKGNDERHTQCLYWSILELQRCSQEEYWLTSAACRAYLIDDHLPGKMIHLVKIILNTFFGDGDDFAVTGCRLSGGAAHLSEASRDHR